MLWLGFNAPCSQVVAALLCAGSQVVAVQQVWPVEAVEAKKLMAGWEEAAPYQLVSVAVHQQASLVKVLVASSSLVTSVTPACLVLIIKHFWIVQGLGKHSQQPATPNIPMFAGADMCGTCV